MVQMFFYTVSARGIECANYIPIYRAVVSDSTVHNVEITGGEDVPLD
jgi:hypothetical protein